MSSFEMHIKKGWFIGLVALVAFFVCLQIHPILAGDASPPHEEHAAEVSGHEEGAEHAETAHHVPEFREVLWPLIFRSINFIIFAGILVYFLRKPLKEYLATRRKVVEEAMQHSAERKAWAEQKYAEYNQRLQNIGQEISELKEALQKEGHVESEKIIRQGKKLAETIRTDALAIAEANMEDLKNDLRRQVIETAAQVAQDTIQKALDQKDQERLTQEFVGSLKAKRDFKTQGGNGS